MIVESDGYRIDFTDAVSAFKFDETDPVKPFYHGVTALKAVDIVAEFDDAYVLVEIKDFDRPDDYYEQSAMDDADRNIKRDHYKWLKNYLKYKYRDSYLYRYAENKVNKQLYYICILNFDNALNSKMANNLRTELPVGKKSGRWTKELLKSCQVLNLKSWNHNFPKWPASKITGGST